MTPTLIERQLPWLLTPGSYINSRYYFIEKVLLRGDESRPVPQAPVPLIKDVLFNGVGVRPTAERPAGMAVAYAHHAGQEHHGCFPAERLPGPYSQPAPPNPQGMYMQDVKSPLIQHLHITLGNPNCFQPFLTQFVGCKKLHFVLRPSYLWSSEVTNSNRDIFWACLSWVGILTGTYWAC
jgi:hypothetical protein